MLDFETLGIELPRKEPPEGVKVYSSPEQWGWSKAEADALFKRFEEWQYCTTINKKSGLPIRGHGVGFAVDPNHSQVSSTYDNAYGYEEDDHCDGPTLLMSRGPDNEAPPEILSLSDKLTKVASEIESRTRVMNFLSIQKYDDHTVGIDWHNHNEDFGIETPLLIVSTGAERYFWLGLINKSNPKQPTVRWPIPAPHGSLIYMPGSFNNTHWHAILPEEGCYKHCGVRISVNTKCLAKPRVFSLKAGWRNYPRGAVYVGCRYPGIHDPKPEPVVREGTIYGNDHEPFKGHYKPIAHTEAHFRMYAEKKMQDPAFRAQAIKDLKGKHLLCFCKQLGPGRYPWCHARVWLDIVNDPL